MNAQKWNVVEWVKDWKEASQHDHLLARMGHVIGLMIAEEVEVPEGFLSDLEKYVRENPEEFHIVQDHRGRFADVILADGISKRMASQMVNPPAAMMSPFCLFDGMKKGLSRVKLLVRRGAPTPCPDTPIFNERFRAFASYISEEIVLGRSLSYC